MKTYKQLVEEITLDESSMPPTEDRGRLAVINAPAKIKRIGGTHRKVNSFKRNGTFHLNGKEVGHVAHGRYFLDKDLMDKHGWPQLTNAHMDM